MNQQCKVCGEPAAGFHFGAFTCEGCKSFFGRTYNNMSSISECKNNGDCVINKKNRTSCKSCRLRKCLLVGMSKSGSRYGRRSNWFKIHCLLQEQGAANGLNGHPLNSSSSFFSSGSAISGGGTISTNGGGLYHRSSLLNSRSSIAAATVNTLNADKFLEARLNGFSPFSDKRSSPNVGSTNTNTNKAQRIVDKYRHHDNSGRKNSSEDSGGSSIGDVDEECGRSSSVPSRTNSSTHHQTPSPFSDTESGCSSVIDRYNHRSAANNSSVDGNYLWKRISGACTTTTTPISSTVSSGLLSPHYHNHRNHNLFRPLGPITYPVSARVQATTAAAGLLYLESVNTPRWNVDTSSSAIVGRSTAFAARSSEEKPIDLSAKSSYSITSQVRRLANSPKLYDSTSRTNSSHRSTRLMSASPEDGSDKDTSQLPLDLTSKRTARTREELSTVV